MQRLVLSLAVAACLMSPASLRAQVLVDDHPTLDAKACTDRERLILGDTHELEGTETDGSGASEKLARTDGVICPPPDLDADINTPAPGGGRTPVIPPSAVEPETQAK